MKASDLKGRAVVALSNAAKLGQVDDVLLDAAYRRVLGFRVKKGAFSSTEAVARANVSSVGRDAITVTSPDVLNVESRIGELAGAATLSQVQGTRVVTEGGDLLGTIAELDVDDEVNNVVSYSLSAPLWDRITRREHTFEAQQVLRLGDGGIMIVSNAAAESLRPPQS